MTSISQRTIILASGNTGKLREIGELLGKLPLNVVPQSHYATPEAAETGMTFIENALLKARNAARHTGLSAIADDSGLEVDALDGAPGIYSSRYAGDGADSQANNLKLLAELEQVPEAKRTARFQCVMVYLRHEQDPTPIVCQGTWEGSILLRPKGVNGFGYDPVFYVPTHGCASAELTAEVKNRISHRGQALQLLLSALQVI